MVKYVFTSSEILLDSTFNMTRQTKSLYWTSALAEHTRLFFYKAAYWRYEKVPTLKDIVEERANITQKPWGLRYGLLLCNLLCYSKQTPSLVFLEQCTFLSHLVTAIGLCSKFEPNLHLSIFKIFCYRRKLWKLSAWIFLTFDEHIFVFTFKHPEVIIFGWET